MEEHAKKEENKLMIFRECWAGILILSMVSVATIYCCFQTTERIVNYQVQYEWNQHAVLTDYNDIVLQSDC